MIFIVDLAIENKPHEYYSYLRTINQFVTLELCGPQLNAIVNGGPTGGTGSGHLSWMFEFLVSV